jgi:hypothetical protein
MFVREQTDITASLAAHLLYFISTKICSTEIKFCSQNKMLCNGASAGFFFKALALD